MRKIRLRAPGGRIYVYAIAEVVAGLVKEDWENKKPADTYARHGLPGSSIAGGFYW